MKLARIIWLGFVLLTSNLFSSKNACSQIQEKQFGLGIGWFNRNFSDKSVTASNSSGSSVGVTTFFRSNGLKDRHHIQILYATPNSQSNYILTRELTGFLQYAYHRKVARLGDVDLFVGSVLDVTGAQRKHSEIGNFVSYSSPFSEVDAMLLLSPSLLSEFAKKDHRLSLQLWFTLLGASRSSNTLGTSWGSLTDFCRIEIRASYSKSVSTNLRIRFDYQVQSFKMPGRPEASFFGQQAMVSLIYVIQKPK
jgi:hypothetical protein